MEQTFFKYQGTGNDFIIFDNRKATITSLTKEIVSKLCDRRFGIGADGLILLCNKEGYDFEMVYYNSDGNLSSMCGNGGRCIVRFANDLGIHKSSYSFFAVDGPHEASIDVDNIIRLKMQDVNTVEEEGTHAILNTGSPHYVKFSRDVRHLNIVEEGRAIRNSAKFEAEGINVNFVENIGSYTIYVRTYERGVEDETYSCGTGVTAAALVSAHNERGFNHVEVQTNGGQLGVEFYKSGDHSFNDIFLCGPAIFVFKGTVNF